MKKFEYMVGGFTPDVDDQRVTAKLNTLGELGWELISVTHTGTYVMFYLKREKGTEAPRCPDCDERDALKAEANDGMTNAAEMAGLQ